MSIIGRKVEYAIAKYAFGSGTIIDKVQVTPNGYMGEPAVTAYLVVNDAQIVSTVQATNIRKLLD